MQRLTRRYFLNTGASLTLTGLATGLSACSPTGLVRALTPESDQQTLANASDIVRNIKPTYFPNHDFKLSDFAPSTTPKLDARPAILAAIEACHNAGGGRVIIPAGTWLLDGPLHLKSNVNLHLDNEAILRFLPNHASYLPVVLTRWEGTEAYNYSPFIYGHNLHNVAITGKGCIDGQGKQYWLPMRKKQKADQRKLRDMGRDGVAVKDRVFGNEHFLRPQFIQFINCNRVLIDGPTIKDSPFWCIHPVYCQDVIVRNIHIDSLHLNSDGVDPDSSSNVLIENCNFNVGDDGVALKAGRDQDGWRIGIPCERIVIRNNRYSGSAGGGMAIGSEMSGGVRDIYVDGYDIPEAHHGLYFKANLDRGGLIENIHIRNINAGNISSFIIFTNDYHSYRGGNHPPRFEQVFISHAHCQQARIGIHITGDPSAPVNNIQLKHVSINVAERAMQIADAKNLCFDNVRINGNNVAKPIYLPRDQFLSFKR